MTSQTEVSTLDRFESELRKLTGAPDASPSLRALDTHWDVMRGELLPTERLPLRDCPSCGRSGFAAATRCSGCWTALTPV